MPQIGPPPPGGNQNRAVSTFNEGLPLLILSILLVTTRFIARATGPGTYSWDDWSMLLALAIAVVYLAVAYVGQQRGSGRHVYYLDISSVSEALHYVFITEILALVAICFVKLSVAIFLIRIGGIHRWIKHALIYNMVLVTSSTIAFVVVICLLCRPIAGIWDPIVRATANCLNPDDLLGVTYTATAISIFTDLACAILPFFIVWDLNMKRKTKVTILSLMCLGFIPAVCGTFRMVHIKDMIAEDITWDIIPIGRWAQAELLIGIIVGSAPHCHGLFIQLRNKYRSRHSPKQHIANIAREPNKNIMLRKIKKFGSLFSSVDRQETIGNVHLVADDNWEHLEDSSNPRPNTSDTSFQPLVEANSPAETRECGGIRKTEDIPVISS